MVSRFFRLVAASGLVVAGLALPQSSARAGMVTFTATTGGSALAGQTYASFDNRTLGSMTQTTASGVTTSFTNGGAFVAGSVGGQYSAPILSGANNMFFGATYTGADTTTYISTGGGTATLTFATSPVTYFGLLWGSIDSFNSLTFNFTDNTSQTVTGAAINTALGVTDGGTAYVNFLGSSISSVVASSTQNSFEFDNVAFGAAVPEPSSLALCGIAGVVSMGVARVRRRRPIA